MERELLLGLAAVALVLLVRRFLFTVIRVKGNSMRPTLRDGQFLLLRRTRNVERGDIVICRYPGEKRPKGELFRKLYVKRLIGLPGETVTIADGEVSIDGHPLREAYLPPRTAVRLGRERRWELGPDECFVLGDNRTASRDSRSVGPLKKGLILGRIVGRGR